MLRRLPFLYLGYLSDRFSRKAIIIPALILYGSGGFLAGSAAAWFSNAYTWILAGRVMQGLGAAGTAPIAMALTGDLFKGGEQSKVLGLVEASNGFGKVISPISRFIICPVYSGMQPFSPFQFFAWFQSFLTIFFIKEKKAEKEPPPFGKYVKGLVSVFKTEGRWLFAAYLTGATCLIHFFRNPVLYFRYFRKRTSY